MEKRPRRLRASERIRRLTRETRMSADSLILPLFIKGGENEKKPIKSLEGHYHYSVDRVSEAIESALGNGVANFLLFGIPEEKDENGSGAWHAEGIVQRGLREIRRRYGNVVNIITDVCLCEYTSHGHCGVLKNDYVDNDPTLDLLAKTAVSHAESGADIVAPSDMMDGRVAVIRAELDNNGYNNTPIMSYAVKYASAFYGPFRDAAGSAPSFGDRKTYQMDWHNSREAIKEMEQDDREGADILMVKPALGYLDVIASVVRRTNLPVAAYSVSGEYAMIKAAAKSGLIDEYNAMCESAVSVYRAGAGILITYYAEELSRAIQRGDIG